VIREAHNQAIADGFVGTDDASLVERLGVKVHILPGSHTNIKITTPEDFVLASLFLKTNPPPERLCRKREIAKKSERWDK
jgi:2-C-methyl-D-erythritol 4-phosphate cytidylyltransferase